MNYEQELVAHLKDMVGADWYVGMCALQDRAGFQITLATEVSYKAIVEYRYEAVANKLASIKFVSALSEENKTLRQQNEDMKKELDAYRSMLPNLVASLGNGEH